MPRKRSGKSVTKEQNSVAQTESLQETEESEREQLVSARSLNQLKKGGFPNRRRKRKKTDVFLTGVMLECRTNGSLCNGYRDAWSEIEFENLGIDFWETPSENKFADFRRCRYADL